MTLYHCSQAVQWDTGWQEVLNPLGWLFQPTYSLTIVFVSCKVEQRCPKVLKYPKCSKAWWFRYMTGKWIQMLSLKNTTGHRFLISWGNSIPEYPWVFPTVIFLFEKSSLLSESRIPPPQGLQNRNCLVKISGQLKQNWNSGNLLFGKKKNNQSALLLTFIFHHQKCSIRGFYKRKKSNLQMNIPFEITSNLSFQNRLL